MICDGCRAVRAVVVDGKEDQLRSKFWKSAGLSTAGASAGFTVGGF